MGNSYMKSAYLPTSTGSSGLRECQQKDAPTVSGSINRVLRFKLRGDSYVGNQTFGHCLIRLRPLIALDLYLKKSKRGIP